MNCEIRPAGIALLPILLLVMGCSELINPYRDELPATETISTASAKRVYQQAVATQPRDRGWPVSIVQTQDQGVSHWPLWWSEQLEDSGSDDGRFAWTWVDYFGMVYCPARQAINTAAVPVSMLVDLPGSIRCSDGMISPQTFGFRNHDPIACSGDAIPPDIIEAYAPPLPIETSSSQEHESEE